ncbi:MAG: sigma-70 family RNA polymerase sigma factor [Planctomycetales bacterium]|nr:sigma-70 family RNA polymerase sigma factor [Planctomycetales bacterium]
MIRRAHEDQSNDSEQARHDLVMRYAQAIRKYVAAILRDESSSEELAQEVIIRVLQGDFASADPERGRFRDFLKTVIRNMARNHWNQQNRRKPVEFDVEQAGLIEGDAADSKDDWESVWRAEILELTWSALQYEETQKPSGMAYTLLRLRSEHPDESSEQLAKRLGDRLNRVVRADALRQKLRRARVRFAELLLMEIANGLTRATASDVEEELVDLQLYRLVERLLPEDWRTRFFNS